MSFDDKGLRINRISAMIELRSITNENVKSVQRLDQIIFPVTYNKSYYKDLPNLEKFAKLAFYNGAMVGTVCCRREVIDLQKRLYIMTLGCLPTHRRLGIGTFMLNHVLQLCKDEGGFEKIYLHVHTENEEAIEFYRKFGFDVTERKTNYYRRLPQPDAFLLEKVLSGNEESL